MKWQRGYEGLAIAITRQAAIDYREAYGRYLRTGKLNSKLISLDRFFDSKWGRLVTLGQGHRVRAMVKSEVSIADDTEDEDDDYEYE